MTSDVRDSRGRDSGRKASEDSGPGPAIPFERIRERAYDLWERNHRPEGLEFQFWILAERELRAEAEREPLGRPRTG